MKSKHPGLTLWQFLAGHALTSGLCFVLIAFCVLSRLVAQEPRPFSGTGEALEKIYSPELLYGLRQAGLTDLFRSGWFIFFLIVLVLNLLFILVDRWPAVWGTLRQKAPAAVQAAQLVAPKRGGRNENYLGAEASTAIGREAFRELVQKWAARHRLRKPRPIRDEGGLTELQLAIEEHKVAPLLGWIAHLAAIGILLGVLAGALFGFEGRMIVEEGMPARHLEVLRGADPRWPAWVQDGMVMPGFRNPGFEVQLAHFDSKPRLELRFLSKHGVSTGDVGVNEPARYRGLSFLYRSHQPTNQPSFLISVMEGDAPESVRFSGVVPGREYELEGASFKIISAGMDEEGGFGPSVQVEYREDGSDPERFWIFKNHPAFDKARRKISRFHFVYEGSQPRMSATLQVVRDPGAPWVLGSGIVFFLALAGWAAFAHHRYWFCWKPSKAWIVGASERLLLFAPRFEKITRELRKALEGPSS